MKKYGMIACLALAAMVLMTAQSDAQSLFNGFDTEGYTTTLPSAGRIKTDAQYEVHLRTNLALIDSTLTPILAT